MSGQHTPRLEQVTERPGLATVIDTVAAAFGRLGDAFAGYRVNVTTQVEPGKILRTTQGGTVLHMHPLDDIARRHDGDPHARLDEAIGWIYGRAHAELDALAERILAGGEADRRESARAFWASQKPSNNRAKSSDTP